jgi:pilus assembly protein Flp/PilA
MLNFLQSYMITRTKSEKGASAVEYGLLVAGIAALIVVIVFALGGVIEGAFNDTCSTVKGAGSGTVAC